MDKQLLEIYADYLMSSFPYTTATGLLILSEGKKSHDKVKRFFSSEDFTCPYPKSHLCNKQLFRPKLTLNNLQFTSKIINYFHG